MKISVAHCFQRSLPFSAESDPSFFFEARIPSFTFPKHQLFFKQTDRSQLCATDFNTIKTVPSKILSANTAAFKRLAGAKETVKVGRLRAVSKLILNAPQMRHGGKGTE